MRHVGIRITPEDDSYLKRIIHDYRFKSYYQLLSYILHSFIQACKKARYEDEEDVSEEISDMFQDFTEAEQRYTGIKPKRRCNTTIGATERMKR